MNNLSSKDLIILLNWIIIFLIKKGFFMSTPCSGKRLLDHPSLPLPKRLKIELIPSIPQFIAEMNLCLKSNLGEPLKIEQLEYKIDVFPPFSLDMQNPFYGAQLYEIAKKCLSYDPNNNKFKLLKKSAEKMRLPLDLIQVIFKLFAQGQCLKAMFSRIDDPLSEIKFPTMVDGALVQIKFTSLLHRIGSVSKKWRKTLFSVFTTKISIKNLKQLKMHKQEDLIQLFTLCRGHFSSLSLIDYKLKFNVNETNWQELLLGLLPDLKKLKLSASDRCLNEILHSPLLGNLQDLKLIEKEHIWTERQVLTVLKTVNLTHLRSLSLCNVGLASCFLPLPSLSNLKSLNFVSTLIPSNPFTFLDENTISFPHLEEFILDDCNLSDIKFLTHFAAPQLYKLGISHNGLNLENTNLLFTRCSFTSCVQKLSISLPGDHIKEVGDNPEPNIINAHLITHLLNSFRQLRVLEIVSDMYEGTLDEEGALALATHSQAIQLQTLNIESSLIENEGMGFLVNSSNLTNLQKLCVTNSRIGLKGLRSFTSAQMGLKSLVLDFAGFDDQGIAMEILTTAASTARMELLSLKGCQLSLPSQEILANTSHFTILRELLLAKTGFTKEYTEDLVQNSHFANLETLDLSNNGILNTILIEFAKSTALKRLKNLLINGDEQTTNRIENILFNKQLENVLS